MPEHIFSKSLPSTDELLELLRELERRHASPATRELFRVLASYPPDLRLGINVKRFLGELVLKPNVDDILIDGLRPVEKKALEELDQLGMPLRLREVGHGLLGIHERYLVKRALSKAARDAKESPGRCIDTRPLDAILGDSESL